MYRLDITHDSRRHSHCRQFQRNGLRSTGIGFAQRSTQEENRTTTIRTGPTGILRKDGVDNRILWKHICC
jgi:hypothetical protein